MSRKVLWAIIVVIVAAIVIFMMMNQTDNQVSDQTNSTDTVQSEETSNSTANETPANTETSTAPANTETQPPVAEPGAPQDLDIAVFEITYDGTSFSPSQLTIKAGDVVIFKNESNGSFWPASGPHPQHTNYPEFDPKKAISTGQDWQFKFSKAGTWPFHDHLNSSVTGRITVQ